MGKGRWLTMLERSPSVLTTVNLAEWDKTDPSSCYFGIGMWST